MRIGAEPRMRLIWQFFVILLLVSVLSPVSAKKHRHQHHHHKQYPAEKISNTPVVGVGNLSAEIDRIANSMGPNLNVGIQIKSMKDGNTLYAKNEYRLFVP